MMEQTPLLISIIVPVYKVEKYLSACIDSILAQTYTKFELILINDGSPDNSGKICDEYARKDSRIKVIHQANSGVTKARATGINQASGTFVTFVDPDDYIPKDSIEILYSGISPDVDIVVGKIENTNDSPINDSEPETTEILNIESFTSLQLSQYHIGATAKLFRKDLFNGFILDIPREIVRGEDWIMNIRLCFNSTRSVRIINKIVYVYTIHATSITHRFKPDLNYEELFFKYYLLSIPQTKQDKYLDTTIKVRLRSYFKYTGYVYNIPNKGENFYKSLYNDIKRANYRLAPITKLLFITKSPIIRIVIITIRKIFNKMGINLVTL